MSMLPIIMWCSQDGKSQMSLSLQQPQMLRRQMKLLSLLTAKHRPELDGAKELAWQ